MALLNMKKIFIVFFLSLGFYLPVSFFANSLWNLIESERLHSPRIVQEFTYSRIHRYINATNEMPETINEVCAISDRPELREQIPKCIHHYDPNAWKEPMRIFFLRQKGPYYWITFGDGTQAILRYWRRPSYLHKEQKPKPRTLDASVHKFEHFPRTVFLGSLAILITTLVNSKLLRKKKVNTS